jgi:hypothetical protein
MHSNYMFTFLYPFFFQEYKENAPECSSNGTFKCGACGCNSMHFGKKCQCIKYQPLLTKTEKATDCNPGTDAGIPDCSDHGTCTCEVCQCSEVWILCAYSFLNFVKFGRGIHIHDLPLSFVHLFI